ncbi:plasmid replication protein RepC [Terrarubrum flagellatum]|uniref:plasmid replication protein RepC n=1 Tax=Terrirubrum flagellatum TaxID=2895980 RepID=UPI00314556D9
MTEQLATTPFGRRQVTLGQIATGMQVREAIEAASQPGSNIPAAVNKWALYRSLTEIKQRLGLSDRALSVLNALLSFQQETALSLPVRPLKAAESETDGAGEGASCELVVFPSNRALSLRAHGMSETTLRRHLAALVGAGLIARRDSPNGKRYARKGETGEDRFSEAFGFDLTPLVVRAPEFEAMVEELRAERRAARALKERISLHRRDIEKLVACGVDEGVSGPWAEFTRRFLMLLTPLRRVGEGEALGRLAADLAELRAEIANILEMHVKQQNMAGNDRQNDGHQSNSKTQWISLEPASKKAGGESKPIPNPFAPATAGPSENPEHPTNSAASLGPSLLALGMVLDACPDIAAFEPDGRRVQSWPAFEALARSVRPFLGISPDAWKDAVGVLGERDAAIAIAAILQRSEYSSERDEGGSGPPTVNGSPAIRSPGGYLRALTEQARAGAFSIGPLLMALIGQRLRVKREPLSGSVRSSSRDRQS